MSERDMVQRFHEAMGVPVRRTPTMPSEEERVLRCRLLYEETMEFIRASGCVVLHYSDGRHVVESRPDLVGEPDLAAMAQECADVRYIAHGTDLSMGAPAEVFREVHRANMAKLGPDGKPVRRLDGKVIKPPGWKPPDVAGVLARAEHVCAWCVSKRDERRPKFLRFLQDGPPRSNTWLAREFGITRHTVIAWKREAERRGCIPKRAA